MGMLVVSDQVANPYVQKNSVSKSVQIRQCKYKIISDRDLLVSKRE